MSRHCKDCLRHRQNVNGTYTCTYYQKPLTEEDLEMNSCNRYIAVGNINGISSVMYKDYDTEDKVERIRTCNDCKNSCFKFDESQQRERLYCVRKDAYLVDPSLAGSLCGWYSQKKKK